SSATTRACSCGGPPRSAGSWPPCVAAARCPDPARTGGCRSRSFTSTRPLPLRPRRSALRCGWPRGAHVSACSRSPPRRAFLAPLARDDCWQAERVHERGGREGVLMARTAEGVAELLVSSLAATRCGGHLVAVARLLTVPYATKDEGEIVGVYAIARFKGEGI